MKITIELTESKVKGLKAYFKNVDDVKANKNYIKRYIHQIVSDNLESPQLAVSDYILIEETKLNKTI